MLTHQPQLHQDRRRHFDPFSFTDLHPDELELLNTLSQHPSCATDSSQLSLDPTAALLPYNFSIATDSFATQPFMTAASNYQNPAIRVQRSTPAPLSQMGYDQWSFPQDFAMYESKPNVNQPFSQAQRLRYQPAQNKALSPAAVNRRMQELGQSQATAYDNSMDAQFAMKQAMLDGDDDVPGYSHSSRQSVSSFGNSPATPRTTVGDDFDAKSTNGETLPLCKVESWMDQYLLFDDELDMSSTDRSPVDSLFQSYARQPMPQYSVQQAPHYKGGLLSPGMAAEAAHLQWSQSSHSAPHNEVSAFRKGSPLAPVEHSFNSPRRFAPQMNQQRSNDAVVANAMKNMSPSDDAEPKTISPKDALLDYSQTEEEKDMPLFPPNENVPFSSQLSTGSSAPSMSQNFNPELQRYTSIPSSQSDWFPTTTAAPAQPAMAFGPPLVPTSMPITSNGFYGNGMHFSSPHYRSAPSVHPSDPTPDFPAHLTSMESSASEAGGPHDSTVSSSPSDLQKPGPSNANTGTYSCTVQGCPMRFESPQKLHKHKRESHKQIKETVTPGIGSGMSAAELLARNSQTGPHKCERVNPTTGKPCNIVFSRPYDLTRHEDTIHNGRKQKVRCHLCEEEKTFSRNDALTRHMRVVHPDVDFPGKHRRRG